jgi:hypothetical protein
MGGAKWIPLPVIGTKEADLVTAVGVEREGAA